MGTEKATQTMKALIVDWNFMGDVLMSSPAYRTLSEAGYEVDTLGYRFCREVLEANPYIKTIHTSRPGLFFKAEYMMVICAWMGYNLILQLNTSLKTNALMLLSGIRQRLGYDYRYRGITNTIRVPIAQRTALKGNRIDEIAYLLERGLGVHCDNRDMIFDLQKRERPDPSWVALHVNVRNNAKTRRWHRFGGLSDILRRQGMKVFYTGLEEDREYIRQVDPGADIAHTPTAQTLGTFLTRCSCLVTVNTFPMHLAACLKIPTVALIGGTPASVVCRETDTFKFIEPENLDMAKITIDQVLKTMEKL